MKMGICFGKIKILNRSRHVNTKKVTLIILGLDNAGKTTLAKRLAGESLDDILPTVGFTLYNIQKKGCSVVFYDLGGGAKIRNIWKQYYSDVHGVIYIVDAYDVDRMDESRRALYAVLKNEKIAGKPLLLLANKQDTDGALDEIDIVEKLKLEPLVNQQKCPTLVELCSTKGSTHKTDAGIENGIKWLLRTITKDYPVLNNRVLVDMAAQAEIDKLIMEERKRRRDQAGGEANIDATATLPDEDDNPFKPISQIVFKPQPNGDISHHPNPKPSLNNHPPLPPIDGSDGDLTNAASRSTFSELFFKSDDWGSTAGLLDSAGASTSNRFLKRPKSSGPTLDYHFKRKKKKKKKRRLILKNNKTTPSAIFDDTKPNVGRLPAIFDPTFETEVTVFNKTATKNPAILDNKKTDEVLLNVTEL